MQGSEALSPGEVYRAVWGSTQVEAHIRAESERLLQSWEREATPGFLGSLLEIVGQPGNEESRILAAVVAKNAVGSSLRKTLGSREWSRLQEVEKSSVRRRALQCLLEDPSERVAIQIALLIANIARFEFPSDWPSLLKELTEAASFESRTTMMAKRRALRALKHVLRALRNKRFVAEAPRGSLGVSREDLAPLAERIKQQRQQLNQQAGAVFSHMKEEWEKNFAALSGNGPASAERGLLSNQGLSVIRETFMLLPSWDRLERPILQFLRSAHGAAIATAAMIPEEAQEADDRLAMGGKAFERVTQCVMAAMDRNPVDFAEYLPHFLTLYSDNVLFAMDAATLHRIRPKRRVLLMRFLARALLCPIYNIDWLKTQEQAASDASQKEEVQSIWSKIAAADSALKSLQEEPKCYQLVEAIVTKYLAMTPAELKEWEEDPEQHVRSADVESTPDAETPRPCGVALLLCLLTRSEKPVTAALVKLASELQVRPRTPEVLLTQEACYRALGEAFSQVSKLDGIDFAVWFEGELKGLLQATIQQTPDSVFSRALAARAIWLVGIGSAQLPTAKWRDAVVLVSECLRSRDLVISLKAAASLVGMLGALLEQDEKLNGALLDPSVARATEETTAGYCRLLNVDPARVAEQRPAFAEKIRVLEGQASNILTLALGLESKLEEIESRFRVLQLITVLIELLGDKAQPFIGIVAEALPKVWSSAKEATNSGKETGAAARLHSALIGILTHLVDRLGPLATQNALIGQVLHALLAHALDTCNPESETLTEDALKLLRVTLSGCQQLALPLKELLPSIFQILDRGREDAIALSVLEAYILLSRDNLAQLLEPYMQSLIRALERCVNAAVTAFAASQAPRQSLRQQPSPGVPKEIVADAIAASSLCTLLLQLSIDHSALFNILRSMAMLVCNQEYTSDGSVLEGFLEVLTRVLFHQPQALGRLVGDSPDDEAHFLDRWLGVASRQVLAEILGNAHSAGVGRLRRHLATASLCKIACAQASPALQKPARMARTLQLGLRTVAERPAYLSDIHDINEVIQQQLDGSDVVRDTILSRRLSLTRDDAIRVVDSVSAVTEAAKTALAGGSRTQIFDQLSLLDAVLPAHLNELLGGGYDSAARQVNGHALPAPVPAAMLS